VNPIRWAMLRVRAIVGGRALDRDMRAEMQEHLERSTERLVERGMSLADARAAAKREFGNVGVLQEQARDIRGARWMHDIPADVRFALRYFARHKATTAIIVAVLALATGANTLIFSMFQAQFLRPAPAMPSIAAHVRIWGRERATQTSRWVPRNFSNTELNAFAARRDIFRDVAAWTQDEVVLGGGDGTSPRTIQAQFVTPNFFRVLGVMLSGGQGLSDAIGDTPEMTAVMAYAMAEQLYGDATAAVGRRIVVNQLPLRVVGVAPPRFQGALRGMNEPALWIPVGTRALIARVSPRWLTDEPALSLVGRLASKASREQATALARQVAAATLPDSAARVGMSRTADVIGLNAPPPGEDSNEMIFAVTAILAIGILILLVGCMNVSSLMVAAAVGRRHEIAVRISLGASRARLVRQLVTESTLLAVTGSAIGLTAAWWLLTYMMKTEIDAVDLAPDAGTFAFVFVMALATGILFGLAPALHAIRGGAAAALRDSGAGAGRRSRLQRGFVVAQITLSQPLLVLLGTMLSLVITEYQPLSPEMSRRVVALEFRPIKTGAASQRAEAVDSLVPRIAERSEVLNATPDATGFGIRGIVAGGREDSLVKTVTMEGAAPGWFGVVDVPIILGRDVSFADTVETSSVPVVIGSDLARQLWGDTGAVGRTLASPSLPGWKQDSISMTVVGVYDATRRIPGMSWNGGIAVGDKPVRVYTARGKQWRHDRILVRTRGLAESFVPELRRFVRARAPSLPVTSMLTLAQADDRQYAEALKNVGMISAGATLALLLASLGLYGVVSLAVRQRTREIGIRIAVGAEPMQVARMFLGSGVRAGLTALALGLPLSVAALRIGLAKGLVIAPQVNPYLIGLAIALVLLAVAAAATWIPARRAALVEPANTLRVD
jgi:putative ABC transport system permease protein